jgi:hypothetical protein
MGLTQESVLTPSSPPREDSAYKLRETQRKRMPPEKASVSARKRCHTEIGYLEENLLQPIYKRVAGFGR